MAKEPDALHQRAIGHAGGGKDDRFAAGARSAPCRSCRKSVMPIATARSSSSGLDTTSRAKISPPRHRIAAAVSTPSGAPPVPITAWTLEPSTAAAIPADRSPSPIRRMRAPAAANLGDQLFVARSRSSTTMTRSSTGARGLRDRSQVVFHRAIEAHGVLRARTDDQLLHVDVWRVEQASGVGGGQHRDRVRRPVAQRFVPSSGSTAMSTDSPPLPTFSPM